MYTGEIMIYTGIALMILAFLLFVIVGIVFGKSKRKLIKKIYGEDE